MGYGPLAHFKGPSSFGARLITVTQLPRLKVKVSLQGLEFYVHCISPELFQQFSLNFTQMFLSVRLMTPCADPGIFVRGGPGQSDKKSSDGFFFGFF